MNGLRPRWHVALMLLSLPILYPLVVIREGVREVGFSWRDVRTAVRYVVMGRA